MQTDRMPAERKGGRAAFALFLIAGVVLSAPWTLGTQTIPWDAKAHFYPQFVFLWRALHEGLGVGWTPNVFGGHPQIADPQSLIFAPFYALAAWLAPYPSMRLHDAILFLMLACGGGGLFLYFKDRGWRMEGALVAALAFAFGGSAAWRIQHVGQVMSLAWFPLAFWALARALDRGSYAWGMAAGALAGFMALGRDQVAWLSALVLTGYVFWRLFDEKGLAQNVRRFPLALAGGLIGGLIVALVPVLLTADLAAASNRPAIIYSEVVKGSLHPASLASLFVANLYGVDGPLAAFWGPPAPDWGKTDLFLARNMGAVYFGALPVLALLAARWRGAAREARFFVIAALFLTLYALGKYTPAFQLLYHLPGADLWRRPADATFPLCAMLAFLAGYAVHRILDAQGAFSARRALATGALALAACLAIALWKGRLAQAAGALGVSALLFFLAFLALLWASKASRPRQRWAGLVFALLLGADLSWSNGPNESTALPARDFAMLEPAGGDPLIAELKARVAATAGPDRRDRIELAGLGFAWPNASLSHGLDNDLGYNPVRLALFEDFTGAGDHVALPEQRVFSKAFPSYRALAADLMGLRFIATGVPVGEIDKNLKAGDLIALGKIGAAFLYENPRAFPRVLGVRAARAADFSAILRDGAWPQGDYRQMVLVENEGVSGEVARAPQARIVAYANDRVEIALDAPDGGWIVLNDIWHPGWRARIDGTPVDVLRANVAFRAVRAPAGAKSLIFEFAPLSGLAGGLRQKLGLGR